MGIHPIEIMSLKLFSTEPADSNKCVSDNFHLAKVAAILMVVTGHYFGGFLWIPTQAALFIFGFSSGFYSANSHGTSVSFSKFWKSKITRLLIPLCVFQVFVFVICLALRKEALVEWDTALAFFGLSGVLRWIGIERLSPLGNGLWFLTLLWTYYLLFPVIVRILGDKLIGGLLVVLALPSSVALEYYAYQGVFFYSTAWFFLFGTYIGLHRMWFHRNAMISTLSFAIVATILLKYIFFENIPGVAVIMFGTMIFIHFILRTYITLAKSRIVKLLSGWMLAIYVIHGYLFVHNTDWGKIASFTLSLLLILGVSAILTGISNLLVRRIASIPETA